MEEQSDDLLQFAITNSNEYFLKHAFRDPGAIFTQSMLNQDNIIEYLMQSLQECDNIELCLNVLLRAEFERWSQQ